MRSPQRHQPVAMLNSKKRFVMASCLLSLHLHDIILFFPRPMEEKLLKIDIRDELDYHLRTRDITVVALTYLLHPLRHYRLGELKFVDKIAVPRLCCSFDQPFIMCGTTMMWFAVIGCTFTFQELNSVIRYGIALLPILNCLFVKAFSLWCCFIDQQTIFEYEAQIADRSSFWMEYELAAQIEGGIQVVQDSAITNHGFFVFVEP